MAVWKGRTEFGARVAAARKHAGLTQQQLAPLVGMSQSNLSELETIAFESGKTVQIAIACKVNPIWLATGEGDMLGGMVINVEGPTEAALLEALLGELRPVAYAKRVQAAPLIRTLIEAPDSAEVLAEALRALGWKPPPTTSALIGDASIVGGPALRGKRFLPGGSTEQPPAERADPTAQSQAPAAARTRRGKDRANS